MTDSEKRWLDDLSSIVADAAKANADLLRQGFDALRDRFAQPVGFSRVFVESSTIISRGFVDYLRLSAEHTRRVIDLGRTVSNDIFASLDASHETAGQKVDREEPSVRDIRELRMSGGPGDLCRSRFVLESSKSVTVRARIRHSRFVSVADNSPAAIPLFVDPHEADATPGQKVGFSVEVGIPDGVPPGTYHAMIWIDGFPELSLRVVLAVHEAPARSKAARNRAASGKAPKKRRRAKS